MKKGRGTIWQFRVVKYLLYMVVFVVPLLFSSSLIYTFSTIKYHILTLFIIFATIFTCWGLLAGNDKNRFSLNFIQSSLIIFLLILTISSIFGIDKANSFFSWGDSVNLFYLYILGIFSLIVSFISKRDEKFIPRILVTSVLSSIMVMLLFYIGLNVSKSGGSTLGNNSYLGEYLFFNVLFGFGLFLYYKKYWQKILIALGTLFIFVSPVFINKDVLVGKLGLSEAIKNPLLFMGSANGALMGVGISILTFLILLLVASRKKILKVVGVLLFASFIFGIYYAGQELVNPSSQLHKVYVDEKGGNRFVAWDIAKASFAEHPFLGVGFNNYIYKFEIDFNPIFYNEGYSVERFFQPHNVFWDFASNTGILGLVSFVLLLLVSFISFYRKSLEEGRYRYVSLVFGGILAGYFVQNLFVFDTVTTYLMLFLVLGISSSFSKDFISIALNGWKMIFQKIILSILILASLVSVIMFVILPWVESYQWGNLMTNGKAPLLYSKENKDIQKVSVMGGVFDSTHVAEKLYPVMLKKLSSVNNDTKDGYLKILIYMANTVEKDAEKQPYYSDSYFMIGGYLNLYMMAEIKNGDSLVFNGKGYSKDVWDRSYKALNKAIELSPSNPKNYNALVQTYLIKGDINMAKETIKKSIKIAPWFKDTYTLGRGLLRVPDKDFENYLNDMESKWVVNKN